MARLFPLLARFGLFAPKTVFEPDVFELRLIRIGTREARVQALVNAVESDRLRAEDASGVVKQELKRHRQGAGIIAGV